MDKIRAKLLAWQQEQRPAETLLSKIYDSPLVLPAVFLGAGIVLQYYFAMSLWFWIFGEGDGSPQGLTQCEYHGGVIAGALVLARHFVDHAACGASL